ncbi:MAG TPA: hypothetical protein VL551_13695 [Actinospica sp.]|nr:hypothetical protein [Actinospica sp.]
MPEQSPTLRDMIKSERDNGVTYRQLGSRAVDEVTGKRASASMFYDIDTGKLDRMPHEHHLRAIAVALHRPYEEVREAAIAQWLPRERRRTSEEEHAEMVRELAELRARQDEIDAEQDANRTRAEQLEAQLRGEELRNSA